MPLITRVTLFLLVICFSIHLAPAMHYSLNKQALLALHNEKTLEELKIPEKKQIYNHCLKTLSVDPHMYKNELFWNSIKEHLSGIQPLIDCINEAIDWHFVLNFKLKEDKQMILELERACDPTNEVLLLLQKSYQEKFQTKKNALSEQALEELIATAIKQSVCALCTMLNSISE